MSPGREQRFGLRDVLAGVSVALLLIPQAMAYAELAGLPGRYGLYAAVAGPMAAAFFASSPYLQTGPGALTALLTFGALAPLAATGSAEYVALAALLALLVGAARIVVGWIRAGWLSYLMSRPMLEGFTSAAAILILLSQLPGAFGFDAGDSSVLRRAFDTLSNPAGWDTTSIVIAVGTVALIRGSKAVNPLIPGVVIATVAGLVYSLLTSYSGPVVGPLDAGIPALNLNLPWRRLPEIFIPGVVIAVVGFAEAASIARLYAAKERIPWDPNREFIGQGAANIAAGLVSGMPVGGSFARSSVNYLAGARTRWSGFVAGFTVLVFLPFAGVLSALPSAVLAAIVISAIAGLVQLKMLVRLWRVSRPQALVGWSTFVVTLLAAPRIEQGVLFGIAAALSIHVWREMKPGVEVEVRGDEVHLRPEGVLWFGSEAHLERVLMKRLAEHEDANKVVFHLERLGRVDATGALLLEEFRDEAERVGLSVEFVGVPDHARRVLHSILEVGVAPSDGP